MSYYEDDLSDYDPRVIALEASIADLQARFAHQRQQDEQHEMEQLVEEVRADIDQQLDAMGVHDPRMREQMAIQALSGEANEYGMPNLEAAYEQFEETAGDLLQFSDEEAQLQLEHEGLLDDRNERIAWAAQRLEQLGKEGEPEPEPVEHPGDESTHEQRVAWMTQELEARDEAA
jgi:hypothetical protein